MKKNYIAILFVAALALPLSWASAANSLEFNSNPLDQVGASPETILGSPGGTITFSLQIIGTSPSNAVDFWLTQFSGLTAGVFSITSIDYTGSLYPDPSAGVGGGSNSGDTFNNSTGAPGSPDGVADNRIFPQNGPDLGSTKASTVTDNPAGTNQIATFTLSIAPGAAAGLYDLRSFDYTGFGWSSTTLSDQAFTAEAEIKVNVVPEPATWSLFGLGSLCSVGMTLLRTRKTA